MTEPPIPCPSCRHDMRHLKLKKKTGGELVLDLCFPCQSIWFDSYESEQLTPESIVTLFRLIQTHESEALHPQAPILHCPICNDRLNSCRDRTRSGQFTYHRCLQRHGRYTPFGQFMIEKGFVRQLVPAEIRSIAASIGTIRCSGCGAPIDIKTQDACPHCGAPVAILDPNAVTKALAGYQAADEKLRTIDYNAMADAILLRERRTATATDAGFGDLIVSGIGMALDLLDR